MFSPFELQVSVLRAQDLVIADRLTGTSDPYVIVFIDDEVFCLLQLVNETFNLLIS
jgi:hypothetical protein